MHNNRLIIFFLHAESARGEEELPEPVISGGWAGDDSGCSRWRCGGDDGETQWQKRCFFSTVQRHQSAFSSPPVYPFCSFSPFSPSASLSFPVDIPLFFCVSQFRSFLSLPSRFLSHGPPLFRRLLSFLYFFFLSFPPLGLLHLDGIYRGRGSGNDPAPSHRCAWGAKPPFHLVTAPAETSNGDVACRTRPLCLLIMRSCRWRPVLALKHVGGRDKGKKTKLFFLCCTPRGRRRRNSAASKRHRFIFFFFFNAWNDVVFPKTRRFI